MPSPLVMSCSRTYPAAPEQAFDAVLLEPLERIFNRRYKVIPRIRGAEDQDGTWGHAGQTRTVRLADGNLMHEELTRVDRPHAFGYTITGITGPMKPLASEVHGVWSFDPAGTGTRVTWQWTMHPASRLVVPALPVFRRLWLGYAGQALQRLEEILVPA